VLQAEILVLELVAVDGLATSAVVVGEVATLAHEVGDHTVEGGALVTETFLSGAKGTEILSRLGYDISPQLHDDTANWVTASGEVKENSWAGHDNTGCQRLG